MSDSISGDRQTSGSHGKRPKQNNASKKNTHKHTQKHREKKYRDTVQCTVARQIVNRYSGGTIMKSVRYIQRQSSRVYDRN